MSATVQIVRPNRPNPVWSGIPSAAHPANVENDPLARLGQAAMAVTLAAEEELFDQDTPVRHCYRIVSGCLRTVRLMEDGRRLIDRFLFPGDLLGFAAGSHHDVSAQAVGPAVLRRYSLPAVASMAGHDGAFARFLWQIAATELRAAHGHALLLGRKTATERVASFLLDMGRRAAGHDDAMPARIALPMGRADIADHLGLTVETVSRTLSQLQRDGVITVAAGHIGMCDPAGLAGRAGDADITHGRRRNVARH